jgi:hypothetical protein
MAKSRVLGWIAALALGFGGPAAAQSVVDMHGPDGLPFTLDDPLRVAAGAHNGVFWVAMNAELRGELDDPPNDTVLGFVNLSDMTVSRLKPYAGSGWETPQLTIGGSSRSDPPGWSGGAAVPHYVSGDGMEHKLTGEGNDREKPAVKIDPEWIKGGGGIFPGVTLEELRVMQFEIKQAHVLGCMRLAGDPYQDALSGSFDLGVGAVWAKVKIGFGPLSFTTWKKVGANDPINSFSDLPTEAQDIITGKLASAPLSSVSNLYPNDVVTAAKKPVDQYTCAGVNPSLPGVPNACGAMDGLVGDLRQVLADNATSGIGFQDAVLTAAIENLTKGGNWLAWKDPYGGSTPSGNLVNSMVSGANKLSAQIKKFLFGVTSPDPAPVYSSAFMFNSLFSYGPPGLWLINRGSEKGLIEQFVYARLNRADPTVAYTSIAPDGASRRALAIQQLDLITTKDKLPPPPLPWPPGTGTVDAAEALQAREAWGNGACQLVGDEAAAGDIGADPKKPDEYAAIYYVVTPDLTRNKILYASLYRHGKKSDPEGVAEEIPWSVGPPPNAGTYDLPPNWTAANQTTRLFTVGLANEVRVQTGPAPTTPVDLGRKLEFGWDHDGDATVDGAMGRAVRQNTRATGTAVCFVTDKDTRETGVGLAVLK